MSKPFQDHFSSVAARYADCRPHYPGGLFDYLATLVPADATVWDCAAGNGQATADLATRFAKVVATDASREQIAAATPHPKVEFRVASGEQSGLPDQTIGLITVAQALHWLDLERFYAEAKRVLCSGGLLAVWSYGINEVEGEGCNALVQDFYTNVVGPYWPPERKMVETGYRTIPFPFAELKPPSFRMETRWTLDQLLGYFRTWSATNRYLKEQGRDPVEPLTKTLAAVWGDPHTARDITWPLAVRLGRSS